MKSIISPAFSYICMYFLMFYIYFYTTRPSHALIFYLIITLSLFITWIINLPSGFRQSLTSKKSSQTLHPVQYDLNAPLFTDDSLQYL